VSRLKQHPLRRLDPCRAWGNAHNGSATRVRIPAHPRSSAAPMSDEQSIREDHVLRQRSPNQLVACPTFAASETVPPHRYSIARARPVDGTRRRTSALGR
jgi:hypothetical protein